MSQTKVLLLAAAASGLAAMAVGYAWGSAKGAEAARQAELSCRRAAEQRERDEAAARKGRVVDIVADRVATPEADKPGDACPALFETPL